jgi:hypothetical protein
MSEIKPKQRNIRKRKVLEDYRDSSEDEEVAPEAGQASLKEQIELTRLLQKHRVRRTGIEAGALAVSDAHQEAYGEEPAKEVVANELQSAYVKEQVERAVFSCHHRQLHGLLRKSSPTCDSNVILVGQVVGRPADDPHLQKYIDEQLAKRLGRPVGTEEQGGGQKRSEEDDLYVTPEELKASGPNQSCHDCQGMSSRYLCRQAACQATAVCSLADQQG